MARTHASQRCTDLTFARCPAIAAFVNAAGGLYAGSQNGRLVNPASTRFGHLPIAVSSDGVRSIWLKGNRIGVIAKGVNLTLPAYLTTLSQPVVAQLQNSEGYCFGSTFEAPPQKQTKEHFKHKDKP